MHEHHKHSAIDKSSIQAAKLSPPDAPLKIEVWCEICPMTGFAPRSILIEGGWDIFRSAFCPVCARSI